MKIPGPPGTIIEVNTASCWVARSEPQWERAVVEELLSSQFTYITEEKGVHGFAFYAHRNETWRCP